MPLGSCTFFFDKFRFILLFDLNNSGLCKNQNKGEGRRRKMIINFLLATPNLPLAIFIEISKMKLVRI